MKSFTKKLILNCTGIIFVSFLAVYFLFNAMASNYIRSEAERELRGGMLDVVYLTGAFSDAVFYSAEETDFVQGIRIYDGATLPMQTSRFEIELRQDVAGAEYVTVLRPPQAHWHVESGIPSQAIELIVEGTWSTIRPIRTQSFVSADAIIVNDRNEILTPVLEFLPDRQRAEVSFLVDYYLSNQGRFIGSEVRRVSGANSTYYLSAVRRQMLDGDISILIYTDISSAMVFTNSMNRILGALLVVSGLLSLAISIAMSAKFKRAIVRLCDYADTIGRGNFGESAGTFYDTEFSQLSKSMNNMSNMLQAYENNQKQFFQNASHELRTPLMSIQGYAEGILGDIFNKDDAATVILSEGQKMTDLVSELLYISRMDSGAEIKISTLDVKDLLYECCERVKPIAQQSDKHITIESPSQEIFISVDEEKLERAVMNILSNAIRYAKNDIKVNYHVIGGNLEIAIQDDGDGIDLRDVSRIFERFYKGENGNYGLGLAISRDIVKRLGGSITTDNLPSPKTGAVFTITLPID